MNVNDLKTSPEGIEIIKRHEAFRSKPYLCPAGVPTIGYGATYYTFGHKVKMTDPEITQLDAENLLKKMLKHFEAGVNRYVQREITQNQFDSIVSFSYNLGLGALQRSTLLQVVNKNPNDKDIKYQFSRWVRANGKKLKGLVKRRKEEANLYFKTN